MNDVVFDACLEQGVLVVCLKDVPRGKPDERWPQAMADLYQRLQPTAVIARFDAVRRSSRVHINALLVLRRMLVEVGGQLKLCGMSTAVRDHYRMLNLDGTVFDILPSADAARATLAGADFTTA